MAPFSRLNGYNHCTTPQPIICQFAENVRFVSSIAPRPYKNHENWQRFQCTVLTFVTFRLFLSFWFRGMVLAHSPILVPLLDLPDDRVEPLLEVRKWAGNW